MSNLILAPEIVDGLRLATEPCWLRDGEGNVVGYFHPGKPAPRRIYEEGAIPELSEAEIQRRLSEPGGRTWDQIQRDLDRLV